jgi:NhaA family Na+:H+ antiporter
MVIAIFYTKTILWSNLFYALDFNVSVVLYNHQYEVKNPYLIGGVIMWWFMLHSGIHATVTELLLALLFRLEME